MMIAIGKIEKEEEWTLAATFYAFDIPVPNTVSYQIQHCLRSIQSISANVPRHRITLGDDVSHPPWEFSMTLYVFPAEKEDCVLTHIKPTPVAENTQTY